MSLDEETVESSEAQEFMESLKSTTSLLTTKLGEKVVTLEDLGVVYDSFMLQVLWDTLT